LEALHSKGQPDRKLIFCGADHGKQALYHGLVESFYNAYEESIHIPLIISNPKLQVCGQKMHSLISRLLDIVPTVLANFLGVFQCI
jgi:arylsulfatase A-like enzyme